MTKTNKDKVHVAYVDSGAMQRLFLLQKEIVVPYIWTTDLDIVQATQGESKVVGKRKILIAIDGGIIQEAYLALGFTLHIFATSLLSEQFEVVFSSSIKDFKSCFMFNFLP